MAWINIRHISPTLVLGYNRRVITSATAHSEKREKPRPRDSSRGRVTRLIRIRWCEIAFLIVGLRWGKRHGLYNQKVRIADIDYMGKKPPPIREAFVSFKQYNSCAIRKSAANVKASSVVF